MVVDLGRSPVRATGTVQAVVREHPAGVALIVRTDRSEGGRTVTLVVARVTLVLAGEAGHLRLLHQLVQVLDVVDGLLEDLDFGHFLHGSCSRNVLP